MKKKKLKFKYQKINIEGSFLNIELDDDCLIKKVFTVKKIKYKNNKVELEYFNPELVSGYPLKENDRIIQISSKKDKVILNNTKFFINDYYSFLSKIKINSVLKIEFERELNNKKILRNVEIKTINWESYLNYIRGYFKIHFQNLINKKYYNLGLNKYSSISPENYKEWIPLNKEYKKYEAICEAKIDLCGKEYENSFYDGFEIFNDQKLNEISNDNFNIIPKFIYPNNTNSEEEILSNDVSNKIDFNKISENSKKLKLESYVINGVGNLIIGDTSAIGKFMDENIDENWVSAIETIEHDVRSKKKTCSLIGANVFEESNYYYFSILSKEVSFFFFPMICYRATGTNKQFKNKENADLISKSILQNLNPNISKWIDIGSMNLQQNILTLDSLEHYDGLSLDDLDDTNQTIREKNIFTTNKKFAMFGILSDKSKTFELYCQGNKELKEHIEYHTEISSHSFSDDEVYHGIVLLGLNMHEQPKKKTKVTKEAVKQSVKEVAKVVTKKIVKAKEHTPTINNNYILTKTKINSGLRCSKKLWFDSHEAAGQKDEYLIRAGNRFGEVIKKIYGKGLDLTEIKDISLAVQKTKEAINSKDVDTIYEAAFIYEETLVRTDVLIRKKNGWELLEAKSSGKKKEEHIPDIAIQSFIVRESGVQLASVKLILINPDFTYAGKENYKSLVNDKEDITEEVMQEEKNIINHINNLKKITDHSSPSPKVAMGKHCDKPHECDYKSRCKSLLPKSKNTSYQIIPYKSKELKDYCENKKITDLQDVPEKLLSAKRKGYAVEFQKKIQKAHIDNEAWINPDLKKNLQFDWPIYFVDFETVQQNIPLIIGTKPFERLPFQWSLHKWESPEKNISSVEGNSFLDFLSQDIERKFIESLLTAVGTTGTIFAHNMNYEKGILEQLMNKKCCKDLKDKIANIIIRLKDTLELSRENFYDPKMNGSWSLKDIVNAVPDSISYNNLGEINDGNEAQLAWFICTEKNTSKEEIKKQSTLLKKYCSKDTLNPYYLLKHLINLSERKN